MICCNSYLVTSSKKKDSKVDSTPAFVFVAPPPDNTQTFLSLKIPNLFKISAFPLALAFILTLLTSVCQSLPTLDGISTGVESNPVCPFVHSEKKIGAESTNGFEIFIHYVQHNLKKEVKQKK